jgi:hypothetical protein
MAVSPDANAHSVIAVGSAFLMAAAILVQGTPSLFQTIMV